MSIINWLRENYGWKTKGRIVLLVIGAAIFLIALLYLAENGGLNAL